MREMGVRGLPLYCSDYRCGHWLAISGDEGESTSISETGASLPLARLMSVPSVVVQ
jgi:hypothetical protein